MSKTAPGQRRRRMQETSADIAGSRNIVRFQEVLDGAAEV
jgi:hypothetical protein